MTYTFKERLANNHNIKKMSLESILKRYGDGDLLKREIINRKETNKSEVIEYYKNHFAFEGLVDPGLTKYSFAPQIQEIANFLDLNVEEIISWNNVGALSYMDAKLLLDNKTDWLDNPLIISKIPSNFLLEFLIKENKIYSYSNLLENMDIITLQSLFSIDNIDFSKLNNLEILLEKALVLPGTEIYKKYIASVFKRNNILEITKIANNLKDNDLINFLMEAKKYLTVTSYISLLNSINNVNSFTKENLDSLINNFSDNDLLQVLNGNFGLKINPENRIFIFRKLSNQMQFLSILQDNNLYTEISNFVLNDYTIEAFTDYFLIDYSSCSQYLGTSKFLQDYLNIDYFKIHNENKEKLLNLLFTSIINNEELISKYYNTKIFRYLSLTDYILNKKPNFPTEKITKILIYKKDIDYKTLNDFLDLYPQMINNIISNQNLKSLIGNLNIKYSATNFFNFLNKYPLIANEALNSEEILSMILDINYSLIIKELNKNPELEKKFMTNDYFLQYILKDKAMILKYLPLLKKYHIENEEVKKAINNFNNILEVHPELSLGNTSLTYEFLEDDFQKILGIDFISGILAYDTEASKIAVDLYKQNKLANLKNWLLYVTNNISNNHRMLHYYILAYPNMEELAQSILESPSPLSKDDIKTLEEVIDNQNLYKLKSVTDLLNYFKIKAQYLISNKENLSSAEVYELFLNVSSLKYGVPWDLNINTLINTPEEYLYHKYVKNNVISKRDLNYLHQIKNIISQNGRIELVLELLNDCLRTNYHPTARSILTNINKAKVKDINIELLDLDELRKEAELGNDKVEIKYINGVEYIYLKDYDYKCITTHISSSVTSKDNSTFSHTLSDDYEQYRSFGEKLKQKLEGQDLSEQKIGELIRNDPENWQLMDAISTISAGIASSRHPYDGYAWGKNSQLDVLGINTSDAMVSHNLRDLRPNETYNYNSALKVLYGEGRGEIWFDRKSLNNEHIAPEFIMHSFQHGGLTKDQEEKAAQYFHCPIIVANTNREILENKLDLEERKDFLINYNTHKINNIIYNYQNKDMKEKIDFLLNALKQGLKSSKLTNDTYKSKLEDLKWYFYEENLNEAYERVNSILNKYDENVSLNEETNRHLGFTNIKIIIFFLIILIAIGILIALMLLKY